MKKSISPQRRPLRWQPLVAAVALAVAAGAAAPVWAADPKASQFYEDALTRYQKRDFAGAIIQLKNALKIDAKQLPVQVLLGKALLANSEVAAAEVAFNEALRLGVNRAEVVVPLAQSLVGQAKLAEVINDPRFSREGLPAGVKSQLLLIQAAAQSDAFGARDALKFIEEARALDPNNIDSWLAEVQVRIRSRQFKEALAAADKAIAMNPASAEAHYLRGSVEHVRGDIKAALAAYEKALQLSATHTEARIARAGLYLDQGKLAEVLLDVAEVRRISPLDPRAPYLGSVVAERRGDGKAARAALADITGLLDPVPVEFMRYRPQLLMLGGLSHYGLGANEKARPYLEAAVRQHPESPAAKLLGQIYVGAGNVDRAIETLEAYLRAQPADQQAVVLLATAQMTKGRHARAAQLLQEAVKLQDSPRLRTFLGMTLVGAGKRTDALAELETAFRRDPSQTAAGAALVDLYLSTRQPAKALAVAETLVKRAPNDAQMHTVLGTARAQAGDLVRARASYEQAAKLAPGFQPAQLYLARLDAQTNQLEAATKRLEALLAVNEKNVEALLELGRVAERRGLAPQATRLFEKAADHSAAGDLRPALALVDHHLRAGRVDGATQALGRLNNKAPDALPVLTANANVRLAAKDLPGAQAYLTRASRAAGFEAPVLAQIASQQLSAQDARGAAYTLQKALQSQPDFLPAKAVLVDAQIRLGEFDAAEAGAREFQTRSPNQAIGHALRGDVAAARGQWPAATEAYKRAHQIEPTAASLRSLYLASARTNATAANQLAETWLKSNPKDVPTRRMLADTQARAGNFDAARAGYETLAGLVPNDAEVLNNLANLLLMKKDPRALAVADRALALKPQAAHIIGTAGWAAYQAGQPDRALQLLRDARLRDPASADTRFFLASVLASKGQKAEARDELTEALRNAGAMTYGKDARELLATLK